MKFKEGDRVFMEGIIIRVDKDDKEGRPYLIKTRDTGHLWISEHSVHPFHINRVICDPASPEAQALIGKEIYVGGTYNEALASCEKRVLRAIYLDSPYPFRTEGNRYTYIRAIEEKPIKKMTVSEVCKALGYDVEIVKDQQ